MKFSRLIVYASVFTVLFLFMHQPVKASINSDDPIASIGHGKIFDQFGRGINPSAEFIRQSVDFYIKRLLQEADSKTLRNVKKIQIQLKERFRMDTMTQSFLLLEWLTESIKPDDKAALYAKNATLRRAWYKKNLVKRYSSKLFDAKYNFPKEIADFGVSQGLLRKSTTATGKNYISECKAAGVPIPPDWRDEDEGEWKEVGDLFSNFLNFGNPATVYRYDSVSPAGLCMALPRILSGKISALGVICMGRESSNVCFFDASDVGIDEAKDIETFISGGDLGSTGICTDCHAGENPFVVHPGGPLDMSPDHFTKNWYTPLVRPDWPQNPGPSALLSQVPINPLPPVQDGDCLVCHKKPAVGEANLGNTNPAATVAGRFPDILALNQFDNPSGYCTSVLLNAIAMGGTMPDGGGAYEKHVMAMKAFCQQSVPPGKEVPPPNTKDDPAVVSPPIVIGPLYACAEAIEIAGGVYGAKLEVTVAGTQLPTVTIVSPSSTIISTSPLKAGDIVTAKQEVDGALSDKAESVTVIDHTIAYPNGLPVPLIDPKIIYECGHTIAVRHVRGAKVTVFTNGIDDITYATGGDWSNLPPKIRPININAVLTAQQQMCKESSGLSMPEVAGVAPSPMPIPEIKITAPLAEQNLISLKNLAEGALTTVSVAGSGDLVSFTTAVTWHDEIDVATGLGGSVAAGDQISVVSELCDAAKISFPDAIPCKNLPAPKITPPLVGATSVNVTSAIPGARILIYDAALIEIADGSGTQVGLTRALVPGDILTVIQRLGECTSVSAFQVGVVCADLEECK